MKTLSFTQEYFLCAINKKGNIAALGAPEISACLFVGGILELINHGYITRDKNKLTPNKPWDDGLPYLKPLYDSILSSKKPKNIYDLASGYAIFMNKQLKELLLTLGDSLAAEGCADVLYNQGIFRKKIKYVPRKDAVQCIIEKIRAEFLEDGTMTDETVCLTALLEKSGLLRKYFSKFEKETLKRRIKELKESKAYAFAKEILNYVEAVIVAIICH